MSRSTPQASGRRRTRLVLAASVGVVLALLAIAAAAAQSDLGGKLRAGNDVRVPAGETVATDLYIAAGTASVEGTVQGDLVAVGGMIALTGTVNGDVIAAGGTVRLGGEVTGDVRAAGGQVIVQGAVGEDGVLAGGQLELAADGTIGEDLVVSGGQVTVAGNVTGSITGTAQTYSRTGQLGGSDDVQIQQFQPPVEEAPNVIADAIRQFLSVMLVGLVALWLAPRFMSVAESTIRRRPLSAVGWGLGAFLAFIILLVVIPILTVAIAVALGLLGFGELVGIDILAGIVAMLGLILAFALAGLFLADAILGLALALLVAPDRDRPTATAGTATTAGTAPTPGTAEAVAATVPGTSTVEAVPERRAMLTGRNILLMAVGVAIIVILTSLPVVGGILRLIVVILGLGAVLFALWWRSRERGRPEPLRAQAG